MQGDKTPGISDTVRSTCIFSLDTQQPVCRFTPQGCGSGFSLLPRVTQAILQTTKNPHTCRDENEVRHEEPRNISPKLDRSKNAQPYGSYYLHGKIAGKAASFLLNSDCTTNLLNWPFFNILRTSERAILEP